MIDRHDIIAVLYMKLSTRDILVKVGCNAREVRLEAMGNRDGKQEGDDDQGKKVAHYFLQV